MRRDHEAASHARAVQGSAHEHEKKVYYERTIQTLEQQLKEFQRHLAGGGGGGGTEAQPLLEDVSEADEAESDDEDLEEQRDDAAVAEYVRRAKCAPATLRCSACINESFSL